jgi:WS/DGAT/MGAT family acyltransferase
MEHPYLRDSDAFSWYMEADPLLRSTVVTVALLDHAPDFDRLVERAERACRLAPGFRHKIVQAPMRLANPRWVVDEQFDLRFHVRRIAAPSPGRLADVFDFACQTGMAGFDRERALWEYTLVEGLEGGRAASVLKLHHALTDGIGGMELAAHVFDLGPEPPDPGPMPAPPEPERLSTAGLMADALGHDVVRAAGAARDLVAAAPRTAADAVRDPGAALRNAVRTASSVVRAMRPITKTLSPVMQERRLSWHYDALTLPLDALRRAAHSAGLTLNDAFLAAVSGGLQRYHERHGASVDELQLTMPISIRRPDDPVGGNRITLMRFRIPAGIVDPVARMHRIHELCLAARTEPAIAYTNAIAGALNALPRGYVGSMLKHVDFLASNVPGIDVPVYLAGARVVEWYAFGPTIGAALNATLVSYDGRCFVGLNVDTGAVPDADAMLECLGEGFEVVTHGECSRPVRDAVL